MKRNILSVVLGLGLAVLSGCAGFEGAKDAATGNVNPEKTDPSNPNYDFLYVAGAWVVREGIGAVLKYKAGKDKLPA